MEDKKFAQLGDDLLAHISGGVIDDYGKSVIDNLIRDMKAYEGYGPQALIRKIESMPPAFFDREIGADATMEEVAAYVMARWDEI